MDHASPYTTRRYDRSRGNLNRSPGYLLAGDIGRAREGPGDDLPDSSQHGNSSHPQRRMGAVQ